MAIQRKAPIPVSFSPALWRRPVFWESAVWFGLCAGWVWVISLGDENGFGYFHQPDNGLLAPLIAGTVINAVLFILNTFYAIPRFLAMGQWRQYAVIIIVLFSANVFLQTSVQKLIILFSEPGLSALSWAALAIENTYIPPFVLIISALYKFARDWAAHLQEARTLHEETGTLKQALQETRAEMRVLSTAGAPRNFLQINSGQEKLQIPISTIQYLKSAGNYADIVTLEQSYLAYGALKDLMKALPSKRFARTHRSYVVGMDHIRIIRGDTIYLSNAEAPIGGVYKKAFLQKWKERAQTTSEHVDSH